VAACFGVEPTVHFVPFQLATTVCAVLIDRPTATQNVVVGHETPSSVFPAAPAGSATVDHFAPFQRSASGGPLRAPVVPTAKQLVTLAHDTAPRDEPSVGLGLPVRIQVVPFQRSVNGRVPVWADEKPTARQLVSLAHDTPLRTVSLAPVVAAVCTAHVVPFQCSISGSTLAA